MKVVMFATMYFLMIDRSDDRLDYDNERGK